MINGISKLAYQAGQAAASAVDTAIDNTVVAVKNTTRDVASSATRALVDLLNGVDKVMPSMLPTITACLAQLSYRGSQGSFSATAHELTLTGIFVDIAAIAPSKFGYPCARQYNPYTLNGFCLTQNAMFEISGTVEEEKALEEMFNMGVILEWG